MGCDNGKAREIVRKREKYMKSMVISSSERIHSKHRLINYSSKQLHGNFHLQSSGSTFNILSLCADEEYQYHLTGG